MENPGKERLRAHLRRHNRRVLGLTILTSIAAIVLWAGLYFVAWWLFLIAVTVARPFDFQPVAGPLVRGFAATAAVLCLSAWIARRLRPNEAARDHKGIAESAMDVLLAVPRVTLAIFGTGAASARLSETELEQAWDLLRRMNESEKPIRVQELPVDIPDASAREKIILALQLSALIELRQTSLGPVLAFRNAQARRLAEDRVRLRF